MQKIISVSLYLSVKLVSLSNSTIVIEIINIFHLVTSRKFSYQKKNSGTLMLYCSVMHHLGVQISYQFYIVWRRHLIFRESNIFLFLSCTQQVINVSTIAPANQQLNCNYWHFLQRSLTLFWWSRIIILFLYTFHMHQMFSNYSSKFSIMLLLCFHLSLKTLRISRIKPFRFFAYMKITLKLLTLIQYFHTLIYK